MKRESHISAGAFALALATLLLAPAAHAQSSSPLWERWSLGVGSYFNSADSELRVDTTVAGIELGTTIDLESDLGLGASDTLPQFRLGRIIGRRHELALSYYSFDRKNTIGISRELEFAGTTFPIDASVTASVDTTNIELGYTYYLTRKERFGFGLSGGLVGFELGTTLDARVQLGNTSAERRERASTTLVLPMIGVQVRGLLHDRIVGIVEARYLPDTSLDNWDGNSYTASVALEGIVAKHVRLCVAYAAFDIDVSVDDTSYDGSVNWNEEGFQVYLRFTW